jgi:hypothetical protein
MKQALFLLALASGPVMAEGWYVDIGRGSADAEYSDLDLEGSDQYGRFALGYERADDIAIEAGSLDMGEVEDELGSASAKGIFAAMKGTVRGDQVDFFMRAGLYKWKVDVCAGAVCEKEDGIDPLIGAGVGFKIGPGSLNVELNFVRMEHREEAVNVTMPGVSYSVLFGRIMP